MVLPLLHAVLKLDLLSDPLSLYGRRLCRTLPACCTGTTCLNVRVHQMFAAADILTLFLGKIKNLTRLSEFSCITFKPLNRGRPHFQPPALKITSFGHGECVGGGGGKQDTHRAAILLSCVGGEGEARATVLVLHTLKYMQISLSPISVLLRQPLSIKKSSAGAAQTQICENIMEVHDDKNEDCTRMIMNEIICY